MNIYMHRMILHLRQNIKMLINTCTCRWLVIIRQQYHNVTCTLKSIHKFLWTPITRICPRKLSNGLNESCLKTLESRDITEQLCPRILCISDYQALKLPNFVPSTAAFFLTGGTEAVSTALLFLSEKQYLYNKKQPLLDNPCTCRVTLDGSHFYFNQIAKVIWFKRYFLDINM